jgi:hypothetical protein
METVDLLRSPAMRWSIRIDPEHRLVFCLESRLRGGIDCSPTNVRHGLHRHGKDQIRGTTNVPIDTAEVASWLLV